MMDWIWMAGLVLVLLLGVLLTIVRLPGTWVVVAAAIGFSWHTGWTRPSWTVLCILLALAVVAEIAELAASSITARRAGASRRASICALIGGVVGMFVFAIPIPVIGAIVGAILGCFVGALVAEFTLRPDLMHGARVGYFAAIGQVLGMIAKTMFALLMSGLAVLAAARFMG